MIDPKHIDRLAATAAQAAPDARTEVLLSYHRTFTERWGETTADEILAAVRDGLGDMERAARRAA